TTLLRGDVVDLAGRSVAADCTKEIGLDHVRDFCYVANVVQANLLGTVCSDAATGEVYNVACADSITLNELFRMICDRLATYEPRFALVAPAYDDFRHGDIRFSTASIEKARRML